MEEVKNFIKEAGTYFLATVDGDEPKVRPFGTIEIFEGKLYIQTGKSKNVSKQIQKNGKVQLCAMNKTCNKWLRLSGTLVRDDRREPKVHMLEAYPELKRMYSPDDENTAYCEILVSLSSRTSFRNFLDAEFPASLAFLLSAL